MKRQTSLVAAAILFALSSLSATQAQIITVTIPGSPNWRADGPWTIGDQFTVGGSPITVNALGLMVRTGDNGNNFYANAPIGLWDDSGNLLRTTTVLQAQANDTVTSNYAYVFIAPITLSAGTTYRIGAVAGGGVAFFLDNAGAFAGSGVTINDAKFNGPSGTLTFPNGSGGSTSRWGAANAALLTAGTSTWTGGSGADNNFTSSANWGGTDLKAGNNLVFAGSTRTSPNNNILANTGFSSITFSSGAASFTVGGNAINLLGDVTNNSSNLQTINTALVLDGASRTFNTASGNITVGGVISTANGANGLTKAGAGTLSLTAANTYTGGTTVSAGTLALNNNNANHRGGASTGTITLGDANTGANNVELILGASSSGTLATPVVVSANGSGTATIRDSYTAGHSFLNGGLTLNRATTLFANTGGNIFVADNISGTVGTLTIDGSGSGSRVQTTTTSTYTGNLEIAANGIYQIAGGNAIPDASNVTVNGNLRNQSGANETIGGLSGVGTVTPTNGGGFNLTVGSGGATASFGGTLGTGASTLTLTKIGGGAQTLSGNNTYIGTTAINAGALLVDGMHTGGGLYTVANNATLGGGGSTGGPVTVQSGGKFAPGSSLNTGDFGTGNLLLSSGSIFEVNLDGLTAGTQYDQADVTGSVNLNGSLLDIILGFTPTMGSMFTIIDNDASDAVVGTFNGRPEGSTFLEEGQLWMITYLGGTGNDVVLTATPEPSTLALFAANGLLLVLGARLVRMRQKRGRHE